MKILLIKTPRKAAFTLSVDSRRFIRSYDRVIEEFHKGHVYISKKHINKVFDLLESDDQDGIDRLLEAEKAQALDATSSATEFIRDLKSVRKILREVADLWKQIKRDPKWNTFRDVLRGEPKLRKGR